MKRFNRWLAGTVRQRGVFAAAVSTIAFARSDARRPIGAAEVDMTPRAPYGQNAARAPALYSRDVYCKYTSPPWYTQSMSDFAHASVSSIISAFEPC